MTYNDEYLAAVRAEQASRASILPEVKAAAIADLMVMGAGAVAAKYHLSLGTVKSWKRRGATGKAIASLASLKKERMGALIFEALEANLNAQIAQAYVVADPCYIRQQSAGEVAILHGVLADKAIRIIEVVRPVVRAWRPRYHEHYLKHDEKSTHKMYGISMGTACLEQQGL